MTGKILALTLSLTTLNNVYYVGIGFYLIGHNFLLKLIPYDEISFFWFIERYMG